MPVDYSACPVTVPRTNSTRRPQTDGDAIALGHSQGGQAIYAWVRENNDPALGQRVSFISSGNPENKYRGVPTSGYFGQRGLPENNQIPGTEVIRQYDGWADWPDDPSNPLALLNAVVGMQTIHTD